jgi:hypothetical protein
MIRFLLLGLLFSGCRAHTGAECGQLAEIRTIPMKGERVRDKAYNELKAGGCPVVAGLIERIVDTTPTPDPRQAPPYPGTKLGDVALFVLDDFTDRPFGDALPDDVNKEVPERGVYAYFDYVERNGARQQVRDNWRAWLKAHPRCH